MNKKQNITENKINPTNTFVGVDALVGLPPLQLNEIYNGDSFELCKRVPAKTVDLILEDMPYNTTACEWDVKIDLQLYWETRLRILKPTGVVILTATQPFVTDLIASNRKQFKYNWVWEKRKAGNFQLAKIQPLRVTEDILVFAASKVNYNPIPSELSQSTKERYKYKGGGDVANLEHIASGKYKHQYNFGKEMGYPKNIIKYGQEVNSEHPTQKPVGLFEYLIRTYTNEGDLVFDGFGGSGTTAIAAHKAKRNFIVIEKEKKYFDLAVRRLDIERAQYTML